MLRFLYVASLMGCLLITPAVAGSGDGSSQPPTQAMVRINATGQLEVLGRAAKQVVEEREATTMVKVLETEQRIQKQKVVKDGVEQQVDVPVTVQVEKMVPQTYTYTSTKLVYETSIKAFPASTNGFRRDADKAEIPLYDLAGNRLSVSAVEDRLHDWTLVLISNTGRPLDRKFASLFKPTTIVIGIPPFQPTAMPAYPAPQPPSVAPQPAPVVPSATLETPSALSPVAFLAPDSTPQLPNSPEPTFAFAKVWGDRTLALRTETEKTLAMTCMVNKEVERMVDGKPVTVTVCEPRQIDKTIEIRETVRHPLAEVSVTRAPNKELTKSSLPSVLSVEVLAMVSADGKPVDLLWQRNLREGALVIVAPAAPGGGGPGMTPMAMPEAPVYTAEPAGQPVQASPPTAVPAPITPTAPVPSSPRVIPLPAPNAAPGPAT